METFVYEIIQVGGHYELHINGDFYCSGDTYQEIKEEAEKYVQR